MVAGGDDAVAVGVQDEEVGVGAHLDDALARVDAENAGRIFRHDAGQPPDGQAALDHALAVHQRDNGLDAG